MKTESNLLKSLKGFDSKKHQVIEHESDEFTFLWKKDSDGFPQPDFGILVITYIPNKKLIELKALKKYKDRVREMVFSYERITDIIYRDIEKMYDPVALIVKIKTKPRGGFKTRIWEGDEKRVDNLKYISLG